MEAEQLERMLSPKEVAQRLNVTRDTVYQWIGSGELRAVDLRASSAKPRWNIPESALGEFLAGRSNGAARRNAI